jgi:hypothetical protein
MTTNASEAKQVAATAFQNAVDFHCGGRGAACIALKEDGSLAYERANPAVEDYQRWFSDGKYNIAVKCGNGLFVIEVNNYGDSKPNLSAGSYGVEHTYLGNSLRQTKRIVTSKMTAVMFGYYVDEWPEGLHSCTLVHPTLDGKGPISLLAEGKYILIEPSIKDGESYRFYTPLHIDGHPVNPSDNPLYELGIITLHRDAIEVILSAFDAKWINVKPLKYKPGAKI